MPARDSDADRNHHDDNDNRCEYDDRPAAGHSDCGASCGTTSGHETNQQETSGKSSGKNGGAEADPESPVDIDSYDRTGHTDGKAGDADDDARDADDGAGHGDRTGGGDSGDIDRSAGAFRKSSEDAHHQIRRSDARPRC